MEAESERVSFLFLVDLCVTFTIRQKPYLLHHAHIPEVSSFTELELFKSKFFDPLESHFYNLDANFSPTFLENEFQSARIQDLVAPQMLSC